MFYGKFKKNNNKKNKKKHKKNEIEKFRVRVKQVSYNKFVKTVKVLMDNNMNLKT